MDAQGSNKPKRRRMQGACDICRQRKIRCDSGRMPGNRCSHCIAFGLDCTHVHAHQKLMSKVPPARKRAAAEDPASWEGQRAEMKPLLDAILSPTYQAPTNPAIVRNTLISIASYALLLEDHITKPRGTPLAATSSSAPSSSSCSSSLLAPLWEVIELAEEPPSLENEVEELSQTMKVALTFDPAQSRFFGFSSGALVKTALEYGKSTEGSMASSPSSQGSQGPKYNRREYWTIHPWDELSSKIQHSFTFPEPDLLELLVELYFRMSDTFIPFLHRPTFERSLKAGLHLKDRGFGGCVLAVCAVGSRYCQDKRIFPGGVTAEASAGSHWFRQLDIERFPSKPSLYTLQTYLLSAIYLHGSSTPDKCYYLIAMAVRAAQDAGFHRRSITGGPPTVEKELQKRIWWGLILADAIVSTSVGRPRAVHPADYDTDFPIECDDEYWEHSDPNMTFRQPAGKPSKVTAMRKAVELLTILGSAHVAFYSINKPDAVPGAEEQILAHHDSALNEWVDSLPDHLRWDPTRADVFFDQSAYLFATYYWVQMIVHLPFIESKARFSWGSFAICANAARACSRLMETYSRRGFLTLPQVQAALFKSGVVLLLGIWRGKQAGIPLDEEKELEDVHRCARVLSLYERRWVIAGRFNDVLRALSGASNLPFPDASPLDRISTFWPSCSPTGDILSEPQRSDPSPESDSASFGTEGPLLALDFDYPIYSNELSQPIFQSYRHPDANIKGDLNNYDNFEAMLVQSKAGGDLAGDTRPSTFSGHARNDEATASTPSTIPSDTQAFATQGMFSDNQSLWSGVPTEFDWGAWNTYLTNVEALNLNHTNPGPQPFQGAF